MADRDAIHRDLNKSFQSDREYLRRLGELALTSSLNSLTKSQNVRQSERSSIGSTIINLDRELAAQHYHHLSLDRNASASDVKKDYGSISSTVKSRKHDMSDKHHSIALDSIALSPNELSGVQFDDSYGSYGDTLKRHNHNIIRKYESLKEEYDLLRKKYSDIVGSHGNLVSKFELTQEEYMRLKKSLEDSIQERNIAIRERHGLQQQCTAAIRQWDKALHENRDIKEQLAKVKQQRDDALKEVHQAMAVKLKATKDMARLTEERNAAVTEHSLIMSERDSVHKEIEKLQEELAETQKRVKIVDTEKKTLFEESESLKHEIACALYDRDRVLKACNDLREKYSDYVTGINEDTTSPTSPSRAANGFWWSSSSGVYSSWMQGVMSKSANSDAKSSHMSAASSISSVSTFGQLSNKLSSNTRLDNLEQANVEIETMRKQIERIQCDFLEAQQEVEVSKIRRDWAFSERDKIMLERESIRTLCDKLRRERDRAVSDRAEALRDYDDIKRQRNEALKELKELKDKYESQYDKDSRFKSQQQNQQFGTNNSSRDSAIDTDMQMYEIETFDVVLKRENEANEWGLKLGFDVKGCYVSDVAKGNAVKDKIKVNDYILSVNGMPTEMDVKNVEEMLRKAENELRLTIQRRKASRLLQTINYNLVDEEHGIVLENGFYVSKINASSAAAKEGNLAVGDRVIYINGTSLDSLTMNDVMRLLHSASNTLSIQIVKNNTTILSNSGANKVNNELNETKGTTTIRERQKKMVSCCSQTDEGLTSTPSRLPVANVYQSLSRSSGKRNSAIINSSNKTASPLSSFSVTSSSSSPLHETAHPLPPPPTLLDKAYNKIFGDRKQNSKSKQQTTNCCEDENKTLAELDKVLDKYSAKSSIGKSGKMSKSKKQSEVNCDTWPKYKGHLPTPLNQFYGHLNAVTTLQPQKRKERKSLFIFGNSSAKSDKTQNAFISPDLPSNNVIKEESVNSSNPLSFEPASDYYAHSKKTSTLMNTRSNTQSMQTQSQNYTLPSNGHYNKGKNADVKVFKVANNRSLDYSVVSAQNADKNVLKYYKHRSTAKTRPHSIHDVLSDMNPISLAAEQSSYESYQIPNMCPQSVPLPPERSSSSSTSYAQNNAESNSQNKDNHTLNHSFTNSIPPPPIRHSSSPYNRLSTQSSRSGDSLLIGNEHLIGSCDLTPSRPMNAYSGGVRGINRYCITPSPSPSQYSGKLFGCPSPSHSMDIVTAGTGAHFHSNAKQLINASQHRNDENTALDGLSTFPKRNPRIRIPSNPSVSSKSSAGKLSSSSIEKASSSMLSDRGSPLPYSFHIEWHSPLIDSPNSNMRKANAGDVRSIYIQKCTAPLGIQLNNDTRRTGGVFVSHVTENSLAAQAGLEVGDQLLDICGINMRTATYTLAANVLRQCGDHIRMLVQYNPDKYKENFDGIDSEDGDDEGEGLDNDNDNDDSDGNNSTLTSTPQSSPTEPTNKPMMVHTNANANTNSNEDDNIPGSATSTLKRTKAASRSASNASRTTEKTITNCSIERQSISSNKQSSSACEPRHLFFKKSTPSLGISLIGGNAVGIFVHAIRDETLANGQNGLMPGDQILEYNRVDLRNASAEEAAIELAKPSETVSIVAQYNILKYIEIQDQQGDSFYIRTAFDRPSVDGSLAFKRDDILFVDNTMFNGVPGLWRAWLVDQEGQRVKCGVIPSKYKVEEELMLRCSLADNSTENRNTTSARRSFFRRRKNNHQRSSSRESTKELASFSDISINSCSDSGVMSAESAYDQLMPATYTPVERLSYHIRRPVIVIGPLMEILFDKLEQDFPHTFQRCIPEVMRGSQQMMERMLNELKLIDYRRRGSHFECTTTTAVKEICDKNLHALLDVSPSAVERLNHCQIYPVVVYLKFKSIKQIKEIKDHRYPNEKLTTKAAKEMYEHSLKIESEYKNLINVVIPGSNLAFMCTQVKTCVDEEQCKALWIPV